MINFQAKDIFIVTGASSGIGKETALLLNKFGATVVAVARNLERLNLMKSECLYPENMHIESKDLATDIDTLPEYVLNLKNKYGKFTGLACIAGILSTQILRTISVNDMDNIFKINYQVPIMLAKGFADKRNNIGEGASIVFVASIAGINPDIGQIAYAGSKAALIASSKSISKELSKRNIRCNCISPAWIKTPMFTAQDETFSVKTDNYPLGIGEPIDVANLIVYLLSSQAKWITGQNYILDGGL